MPALRRMPGGWGQCHCHSFEPSIMFNVVSTFHICSAEGDDPDGTLLGVVAGQTAGVIAEDADIDSISDIDTDINIDTGCPILLGPLCFCYFLGF